MRVRPATSVAQPRYSQVLIVELIFGVPVQDGRGPVEVDVSEEVVGPDEALDATDEELAATKLF